MICADIIMLLEQEANISKHLVMVVNQQQCAPWASLLRAL